MNGEPWMLVGLEPARGGHHATCSRGDRLVPPRPCQSGPARRLEPRMPMLAVRNDELRAAEDEAGLWREQLNLPEERNKTYWRSSKNHSPDNVTGCPLISGAGAAISYGCWTLVRSGGSARCTSLRDAELSRRGRRHSCASRDGFRCPGSGRRPGASCAAARSSRGLAASCC